MRMNTKSLRRGYTYNKPEQQNQLRGRISIADAVYIPKIQEKKGEEEREVRRLKIIKSIFFITKQGFSTMDIQKNVIFPLRSNPNQDRIIHQFLNCHLFPIQFTP